MAINKQDLHDAVYAALMAYTNGAYKDEMEAPQHMKAMGDAMKAYFEGGIEVSYDWAGTDPATGAPDPTTSFTSDASFPSFDLTKPMDLPGLAAKITAAFAGAVINHPGAFSVPPGAFRIVPLALPPSSSVDSALMDSIIAPVCDWALTLLNTSPLSGEHDAFVGAATMSAIA
jgi:hypothetical protein